MSIIPQGYENNQECESRISKFFSSYRIGDLLRKCGAGKEKGVAIVQGITKNPCTNGQKHGKIEI